MNIYELMYGFWRLAEEQPFTQSETALYFLLLNRANINRWQMPIRCPTTTACMLMGTSKQNLAKARSGLEERGLITYTRSKSRGSPGQYIIHPFGQSQLTNQLPNELSNELTSQLTNELTTYNIQDNSLDELNF